MLCDVCLLVKYEKANSAEYRMKKQTTQNIKSKDTLRSQSTILLLFSSM